MRGDARSFYKAYVENNENIYQDSIVLFENKFDSLEKQHRIQIHLLYLCELTTICQNTLQNQTLWKRYSPT